MTGFHRHPGITSEKKMKSKNYGNPAMPDVSNDLLRGLGVVIKDNKIVT